MTSIITAELFVTMARLALGQTSLAQARHGKNWCLQGKNSPKVKKFDPLVKIHVTVKI